MAVKTVIEAIREGLLEEMERDERIILLGEDVEEGGVFRVTEGLVQRFGPNRIMDAPLAESAIVGVAIGAAINGLRPVAEIQFADFIHPAMDQIISEAARIRYRSAGDFGCPIVIRWHPRRPLPLSEPRGPLRPRPRPQGPGPCHPL